MGPGPVVWLLELGVLAVVVGAAALRIRASRASRVEKYSWTLALVLAVFLSSTLWDSHADFRGFEDLYVFSCFVLLDSEAKLRLVGLLVALLWVVTFTHRVLCF